MKTPQSPAAPSGIRRRTFLKRSGLAAAAAAVMPHIWIPREGVAQGGAFNVAKHLIYVRLSGGFRFTTAFNGDVVDQFNPFGLASNVAAGAEWGVSDLLSRAPFLDGDDGAARSAMGMRPVNEIANDLGVLACVDHEPLAGNADGNHGTGLERYLTGYVGGSTSFFTMLNYGFRDRYTTATANGEVILPAFVLGGAGMTLGLGKYAAHRPPVMQDGGFERFGFDADSALPQWAVEMTANVDQRMLRRQHIGVRDNVDAYLRTRETTKRFNEIFQSDTLKVRERSDELIDGVSHNQLASIFGDSRTGRNIRLALRMFHFGCPAVYMDQGGYDFHSGEEAGLPRQMDGLNQLISGLQVALKMMQHPSGGTYWDHTLVVFGSEFGRTARGNRFNSARGSDHGGDNATRWMSMPFMGGPLSILGRQLGGTSRDEKLNATGAVYSYRSVLKTLMHALGADHSEFFPADEPFDDIFA